jgi:hypothetical protein
MIKPTVGRVVWYRPPHTEDIPREPDAQPLAAIVSYVWGDRMVNLTAFTANGRPYGVTSVILVQEGDPVPADHYAEWMPCQKGQAAKAEALEAKLGTTA